MAVIIVDRQLLSFGVRVHEVAPGRGRDGRTIPIAVVLAVDGDVRNRVLHRILHIADQHERGDLVWNEAARRHILILMGTGFGEGLAIVRELRHLACAIRTDNTLVHGPSESLDNLRVNRLMAVRRRHLQIVAVHRGDLPQRNRIALHAVRGVHGEDARHGQRGDVHIAHQHCRHEGRRLVKRLAGVGIVVAKFGRRVGDLAQADDGGHRRLRGVMGSRQSERRGLGIHGVVGDGVGQRPHVRAALVPVAGEQGCGVSGRGLQILVDGMSRLHPCDQVHRLPRGADGEATSAAIHVVDGVVHSVLRLIGQTGVGRIVCTIQAESQYFAGARFD